MQDATTYCNAGYRKTPVYSVIRGKASNVQDPNNNPATTCWGAWLIFIYSAIVL